MATTNERYFAYLLRIWQIRDAGQLIWRASLEDPHTGKREGFPNLEALIDFLMKMISGNEGEHRLCQASNEENSSVILFDEIK